MNGTIFLIFVDAVDQQHGNGLYLIFCSYCVKIVMLQVTLLYIVFYHI